MSDYHDRYVAARSKLSTGPYVINQSDPHVSTSNLVDGPIARCISLSQHINILREHMHSAQFTPGILLLHAAATTSLSCCSRCSHRIYGVHVYIMPPQSP